MSYEYILRCTVNKHCVHTSLHCILLRYTQVYTEYMIQSSSLHNLTCVDDQKIPQMLFIKSAAPSSSICRHMPKIRSRCGNVFSTTVSRGPRISECLN